MFLLAIVLAAASAAKAPAPVPKRTAPPAAEQSAKALVPTASAETWSVPLDQGADVTRVAQFIEAMEALDKRHDDLDLHELNELITRGLWDACVLTAREQGVSGLDDSDWEPLRERVVKEARNLSRAVPRPVGPERLKGLLQAGREITSGRRCHPFVAEWLGFGKPSDASVKAGTDAAAPAGGGESADDIAAQLVEIDSGTGDIRLDAESTAVLAEVGGAGEGNGYLDVGEWARVWFGLKNVGAKPWFSTSGWFEADGQCLWVNPREEHVIGEMPQNGGTASVDAWLYVSRACTGGARRLKITIRDTHRNPSGMTLSVGLMPLDVVGPRIVNGKFDTDVPGSSDGSGAVAVAPGLKFEYSLDLQVPSKAVQAVRMRYVAPDDLAGLFQQFEYRDVPLTREAQFFRAADDLDAEMAETEAFRKALRDARGSKDWSRRTEKNRLWLAVDSTLMADRPGAVSATAAAEATAGKPAASEGTRDCVPALPSKVVVDLARKYVLLRARPATPTLPGSVVAAEGYEAGIDAERFAVAYDHLLKPPAATAAEPEVLEPKPLLKYRFRSYFPLNLLPVNIGPRPPEPAPDAEVLPPPPEPLEPAPEPAPQPAREPQGPVARIDLGGAWTGYFTEGPTTAANFWNNAGFLSFGDGELRLTFGRTLCFTLLGEFGASIVNPSAAVLAQTGLPPALGATELAIAAGGAYVLRVGERFELMPFLMVGYRYRAIEAFSETHGVDFLFGASLRLRLVAFLGLYADISWRLGTGGPAWQGSEILNGIGPRLGGGLSINL